MREVRRLKLEQEERPPESTSWTRCCSARRVRDVATAARRGGRPSSERSPVSLGWTAATRG
jgi:hypothetical protein